MFAHPADSDRLTNLPNRTAMLVSIEDRIATVTEGRNVFSLLHLEIGRFRSFSKVIGYEAADELIVEICRRIQNVVDGEAARVGEAEFACMLSDGDRAAAGQVAQRLHDAVRAPAK